MPSSAQSPHQRAGSAGRLVRSLVLLAVLIPVTVLFVQVQRATGEQKAFAEKERHGVAYLASLWQLTLALSQAQTAAVAGRAPAGPQALARAVAATTQVDDRFGDELGSHDRWSALRGKIDALPRTFTDAAAAYTAHTQAAEMLLALFGRVRETSGLIRDPDADAYFLEDAAAEELPEVTVAAGRLADLTIVAPTRPASERTQQIATLAVVRSAFTDPAGDLADDLRSAVDSTESRSLSGNLLSRLDLFQRSMDAFGAASAPGADQLVPNQAPLASAQADLHRAAADLGTTIYTELDELIVTRIRDLDRRQRAAVAALALAVLLVATPVVLTYVPLRRRALDQRPPAEPQPVAAPVERPLVSTPAGLRSETDGAGLPGWGRSGDPR